MVGNVANSYAYGAADDLLRFINQEFELKLELSR